MSVKVGDKLKKRYEIKDLLGQGEHGATWKAWDTGSAPPKFCVIKVPLVGSHGAIKELESESSTGGLLHHKNIVPVLEFNRDEGFLVEEFVQGQSLQARLRGLSKKKTWLTLEESKPILVQCLEGLEYAHEKNRVHGDVKPGNIMLPDVGEARLTDFGVSRFVSGKSTSGGAPWDPSRFGSATYAAPEVLSDRLWSVQSDLFSLGVLAYLLLSRKHPFVDGAGLWTTKDRILDLESVPDPLEELVPETKPILARVTTKLLERDPAKRYSSAREVLEDILGKKPPTEACPHCGQDNPPGARYCNSCGEQVVVDEVPETAIEAEYRRAYSLYTAGEPLQAISVLENVVNAHPLFGKGWAQLAYLRNYVRKYDQAVEAANRAIACSSTYPGPYRTKGFALSSLGKFDDAIQQFDMALARENNARDRSQILNSKAYSLMLAGRVDEAEEGAGAALEEDPTNFQARSLLHKLRSTRQ